MDNKIYTKYYFCLYTKGHRTGSFTRLEKVEDYYMASGSGTGSKPGEEYYWVSMDKDNPAVAKRKLLRALQEDIKDLKRQEIVLTKLKKKVMSSTKIEED